MTLLTSNCILPTLSAMNCYSLCVSAINDSKLIGFVATLSTLFSMRTICGVIAKFFSGLNYVESEYFL